MQGHGNWSPTSGPVIRFYPDRTRGSGLVDASFLRCGSDSSLFRVRVRLFRVGITPFLKEGSEYFSNENKNLHI